MKVTLGYKYNYAFKKKTKRKYQAYHIPPRYMMYPLNNMATWSTQLMCHINKINIKFFSKMLIITT